MRRPLPEQPYFVLLSRVEQRPVLDVWPIGLREKLPRIPVPLLAGDADVWLDLQEAFDVMYDSFRFDLALDYSRPPRTPLPPEDTEWAEQLLKHKLG
jgi:hypothetical protein